MKQEREYLTESNWLYRNQDADIPKEETRTELSESEKAVLKSLDFSDAQKSKVVRSFIEDSFGGNWQQASQVLGISRLNPEADWFKVLKREQQKLKKRDRP